MWCSVPFELESQLSSSSPSSAQFVVRRKSIRCLVLLPALSMLIWLTVVSSALALEPVGNCENGWRAYSDGNHYQCDPGGGGAGGSTPSQGGGSGAPDGGGGGGSGTAGGSKMSASELERLRRTLPDGIVEPATARDINSPNQKAYVGSFWWGREALSLMNSWYRDAYILKSRAAPGTGGNRSYCREVGRVTVGRGEQAVVVGCSSNPLSGPDCVSDLSERRVPAEVELVVSENRCVDARIFGITAQPQHGTATVRGDEVVYASAPGYAGVDEIDLFGVAVDGSISTFVVRVRVNAAPSCVLDGGRTVVERGQRSVVRVSCSDPDGDPVRLTGVDQPEHGSVNGSAGSSSDGASITYVSDDRYLGDDEFSVRGVDSFGRESSALTTVGVQVVEPAPECVGFRQDFDNALEDSVPVSLGCGLPGGVPLLQPLEYRLLSQPTRGTISGFDSGSGRFDYTPKNKLFTGVDPVRFTVSYAGKEARTETASLKSRRPNG